MRARQVLLVVYCSLQIFYSVSQELPGTVLFEHVNIPGTIRSSEVTNLLQDPEGLLWISGDGLFRYDGVSFTRYITLSDSGSVAGKEINSLFYDRVKKRLLVATRNHGVVVYDYSSNSLHKLPSRDGTPILNSFAQTSDGKIWASSFRSGLIYLENETLKQFNHPKFLGVSVTLIYALNDQLLVGDISKIMFMKENEVTDSLLLAWPNTAFNEYGRVTALTSDSNDRLYIGTEKKGVLIYDFRQKKFIKYFPPDSSPFYNRINQIFISQRKLVWILTKAGGLVLYSPEKDEYSIINKNPLRSESLSGDNCNAIIQDNTGIIWVGSSGDLNKHDPNKVQFSHITYNPFDKNSLSDKMVRGIFEDDSGNLLVGTDGGFINRINLNTDKIDHLKFTFPGGPKGLVPMYFTNLDKEYILISSNSGVIQMNKRTGTLTPYAPLEGLFNGKLVRQIIRKENKLYLLSTGKLYVHNLLTKQTTLHENFSGTRDLVIKNATCLYLDNQNRMWLGVRQGISLIHEDESFTYFRFEQSVIRPEGSYFMVLTIQEIKGKFWVGTFDSGLWQLDISAGLDSPVIQKIEDQPVFGNNTVYATLPDRYENVWISTNQGIFKYELDQKRFTQFTISEGLQDNEFNRLAYCTTKSGLFVMGGINGINIFDPKKIDIQTATRKPVILSVFGNRQVEDEFYADLRDQSSIALAADQNYLTFIYLVPDYQTPARFEVSYFLENYDVRWNASINNKAEYSDLKPGTYTFKVRVKGSDGLEQISSLDLHIKPPFWQSWWFITLSLGGIALIIYGIVRSYTTKTIRDKARLELLLKERTREIEKSRLQLDNLNQKKDLIFSILSHDLRSPLTTLKGFLSLIIDNPDSLGKDDIKRHANNIRNSVTSSLDLIDNTLFWSLSQTGNIVYTPSYFSLTETLKKIHQLYQLTAEKKRIQFHYYENGNITVYGDENMLYVALRNIVSNALKFTGEGKNVYIEAHQNHAFAEIRVRDEGIGMDVEYFEKLLSNDQPMLKMGTSNEKGTGLGLILCKKFIDLNKGQCKIRSIEHEGSEFVITIPLSDQV